MNECSFNISTALQILFYLSSLACVKLCKVSLRIPLLRIFFRKRLISVLCKVDISALQETFRQRENLTGICAGKSRVFLCVERNDQRHGLHVKGEDNFSLVQD